MNSNPINPTMNNRMPFYTLPPAPPGNQDYHNGRPQEATDSQFYSPQRSQGYRPQLNWNGIRPEPPLNNGWDRNNRNNWKRNHWNLLQKHRENQPYQIPNRKPYKPRYSPNNRFENNGNGYRETNGHSSSWSPNNKNRIPKPQNGQPEKDTEHCIPGTVANKKKRKPMSKSYPSGKWDEKDAEKALQAEKDFIKNLKNQSLIIRFPDPDLNKDIVKGFHPAIENVHFPQASTPRYCFAHLEDDSDLNMVVGALEKIRFGQGYLTVEIKKAREENLEVSAKDIDPYTLYVGNLPMNVTKAGVMDMFSGCTRIDIGHPQQMKNTRYAFVRFSNVDEAVKFYKEKRNTQYESRSLIVRFRRINGNVGVPGETKVSNPPKTKNDVAAPKIVSPVSPMTAETGENTEVCIEVAPKPDVEASADLTLVKEEPVSDGEDMCYETKPIVEQVEIKKEVKKEKLDHVNVYDKNEDDVDDDEEEEFDMHNDNFQYNVGDLEDECEDSEDYDDYEDAENDGGMELDAQNTWLPEDDDQDIYNGDLGIPHQGY